MRTVPSDSRSSYIYPFESFSSSYLAPGNPSVVQQPRPLVQQLLQYTLQQAGQLLPSKLILTLAIAVLLPSGSSAVSPPP
jgi:hypothetical protein